MSASSTAILVLGDLGRSPRMQRHAEDIAQAKNCNVELIGYEGSNVRRSIVSNKNINVHRISDTPIANLPKILYLILLPFHFLVRLIKILILLVRINRFRKINTLVLQNPPSHPTFLLAKIFLLFNRNCKIIIDWHNLGYTIMALKFANKNNFFVLLYKYFEKLLARNAAAHFCVSENMRDFLINDFGLKNVTVLMDNPHKIHKRASIEEMHNILMKCKEIKSDLFSQKSDNKEKTILTEIINGKVCFRENRPFVLVTATSWTIDEDISILLKAAEIIEKSKCNRNYLFLITGCGPMKKYFEEKISNLELEKCRIITLWLDSYEEYSLLLGSCDVGVSLHYSSSNLDLPMKVFDMIGCGLPVFSIKYKAIDCLVKENVNGYIFNSPEELVKKVKNIAEKNNEEFLTIRENVLKIREQMKNSKDNILKTN